MRRARQRGFTLVEMMVVVAIIAVLASLLIGTSIRPYGANAGTVADQMSSTLAFARMRAVSSRKVHRVQFLIDTNGDAYAEVAAANTRGMATPTSESAWQVVQYVRYPKSIILWSAQDGAQLTTGASPTEGAGLPYNVIFKPDGSAKAATIFVRDRQGTTIHYYRVFVYQATGSSYVREQW